MPNSRATSLKKSEGENRTERTKENPSPAFTTPMKPKNLDLVAEKAWDDCVTYLQEMKILASTDSALIEAFAMTYSQMRHSYDLVKQYGVCFERAGGKAEIRKNPRKYIKKNPALDQFNKARDALIKICSELGFSPVARNRIKVEDPTLGSNSPLTILGIKG